MKDEVGDVMQDVGWGIDLVQGLAGVAVGPDGCGSRVFHAVKGRVSCFVGTSVFAGCLAEGFGGGGYVEKVVSDLK
jgi:hypothetical protein